MFEQFSKGYYLGRLYVQSQERTAAMMCRVQHEQVNEQLYDDDRTDLPLVMKLDTRHFPVHGAEDVPADTLALPPEILADTDIRNPPALREVFLAKADRAAQLLRFETPTEPTGI